MTTASKTKTYMSWLTICFMMVAAVASIRSLPSMAVYGRVWPGFGFSLCHSNIAVFHPGIAGCL